MQEAHERLYGIANEFNARLIAQGDEETRKRVEDAGYDVRVVRSDDEGWSVMAEDVQRMQGRQVYHFPTAISGRNVGVLVEFRRTS